MKPVHYTPAQTLPFGHNPATGFTDDYFPCIFLLLSVSWSHFAIAGNFKIEKVTQNIYRFVVNRHRSVFMVTEKGILITDLLNTEAATWLKRELKDEITLPQHSQLRQYNEWLPINIEGVYERLMEESGMSWRPDIK